MTSQTVLTMQEVADLVASVFEYNGKKVEAFSFQRNGESITFDRLVVDCGSESMKVRVLPDSDELRKVLYPEIPPLAKTKP